MEKRLGNRDDNLFDIEAGPVSDIFEQLVFFVGMQQFGFVINKYLDESSIPYNLLLQKISCGEDDEIGESQG